MSALAPPSSAPRAASGRGPLGRLRARAQQWWQSRLPRSDRWTLTQRRVYILPTRAGLMLGATLVLLLVGSINYQLNLGYLLTFLLAGCAGAAVQVGHGTLRGLTLLMQPPDPVHAGHVALLPVQLLNERRRVRHGIGLAVLGDASDDGPAWSWADVPAQGQSRVELAWRPTQRGEHALPALTAETRFPLGIFRVWTVWRPASTLLVYPHPEDRPPPLPPGEPRAGASLAQRPHASGEFEGVRPYRRGDPTRRIVWKKAAKGGELVSRDTAQAQRLELWLDLAATGAPDLEARLSRLTAWVLQADRLGVDYGLRLPGRSLDPDHGEPHRRACLEALARC